MGALPKLDGMPERSFRSMHCPFRDRATVNNADSFFRRAPALVGRDQMRAASCESVVRTHVMNGKHNSSARCVHIMGTKTAAAPLQWGLGEI